VYRPPAVFQPTVQVNRPKINKAKQPASDALLVKRAQKMARLIAMREDSLVSQREKRERKERVLEDYAATSSPKSKPARLEDGTVKRGRPPEKWKQQQLLLERRYSTPVLKTQPANPAGIQRRSSSFGLQKKKRESERFDINNLVVPVMAGHQIVITAIKCKEIFTPTWRSSRANSDGSDSEGEDYGYEVLLSLSFLFFVLLSWNLTILSQLPCRTPRTRPTPRGTSPERTLRRPESALTCWLRRVAPQAPTPRHPLKRPQTSAGSPRPPSLMAAARPLQESPHRPQMSSTD